MALKRASTPASVVATAVAILVFLQFNSHCNAQIKNCNSAELSPALLQQLQGITDRIDQLEFRMNETQEAMLSKMAARLKSTAREIVSEMDSKVEEKQAEIEKLLSEVATGATHYGTAIDSNLQNIRRQMAEFRKLLQDQTTIAVDSNCPEGWQSFDGSCYFFSITVGNWSTGLQECIKMGGDYVKITSEKEWGFIASQITGNTWIGLNDLEEEGTFKWSVDNSTMIRHDGWWHENQPDNYEGKEDCIHYWFMWSQVLWNDSDCKHKFKYICEMSPNSPSK